MTHPRLSHRLLALMLALAALPGCAQPPAPAPASAPAAAAEPESARLAREIQALIGPAACSRDDQCRTLPVGAKACGGPSGYLAWSTQGTDAERLQALGTRHSEAARREVQGRGLRSTCSVVADPGATCVAGRCELARTTEAAR